MNAQNFQKEVNNEVINIIDKEVLSLLELPSRSPQQQKRLEELYQERDIKKRVDEVFRDAYYEIQNILRYYMDLKEEYYNVISLWILGTYQYKQYQSYPFLFINAMKGSGKSRLLRIIKTCSCNGQMLNAITEAVLFRTTGTLCIDEFEGITRKGNEVLRELLNSSYKQGTQVKRMKKIKTIAGEEQAIESFDVYRPIVLANIFGLEEVLGDRCIQIFLEKSNNPHKINLIELFESDETIQKLTKSLIQCSYCSVHVAKKVYKRWNDYLNTIYTYIHSSNNNINNTNTDLEGKKEIDNYINYTNFKDKEEEITVKTPEEIEEDMFFAKIKETGISGRYLELFMPLFLTAKQIDNHVLNQMIQSATKLVNDKKKDDEIESLDVSLYDFIEKSKDPLVYYGVKDLTGEFKGYIGELADWLNAKWMGRALKRLSLVTNKRRVAGGYQVMLNTYKAREKLKMFESSKVLEKEDK